MVAKAKVFGACAVQQVRPLCVSVMLLVCTPALAVTVPETGCVVAEASVLRAPAVVSESGLVVAVVYVGAAVVVAP